jgi:hypothetical protein
MVDLAKVRDTPTLAARMRHIKIIHGNFAIAGQFP